MGKCLVVACLLVVAVGLFAVLDLQTVTPSAIAARASCGVERWRVKTLGDRPQLLPVQPTTALGDRRLMRPRRFPIHVVRRHLVAPHAARMGGDANEKERRRLNGGQGCVTAGFGSLLGPVLSADSRVAALSSSSLLLTAGRPCLAAWRLHPVESNFSAVSCRRSAWAA